MEYKYKTIYADPPWPERGGGKIKRGADRHYKLMSIKEIMSLKTFVQAITDENCHLYLWVTNTFLKNGLEVIEEWGFKYITLITWMKDRIGLGQYFRGLTEHCIFARKGMLPYKIINERRQQGVTGFYEPKTFHSCKPIKVYEMIEKVSYPPRIELFARSDRPGWDTWGNEV